MPELRDIKPPYLEIIELIRKHRKALLGKTGPTPIPITQLREITSTQYINDCFKALVQDKVIAPIEQLADGSRGDVVVDCLKTVEEMYEYRLSLQHEVLPNVTFPISSWEVLEIRFITEYEILITANEPGGTKRVQYAFNNIGFDNQLTQKPNQSWEFLTLLAIQEGKLDTSRFTADQREKAKKEKQALKKNLQRIFKLETDPFYPFSQNRQYELICKVEYMTTE